MLNALDNLAARRHVNRLCIAAGQPLIEAGSTGCPRSWIGVAVSAYAGLVVPCTLEFQASSEDSLQRSGRAVEPGVVPQRFLREGRVGGGIWGRRP